MHARSGLYISLVGLITLLLGAGYAPISAQTIIPNPCPVYPLNTALPTGSRVLDYTINAETLLYRVHQDAADTAELYALNFIGATPVKLNPPLAPGGDVQAGYVAHRDYVVFLADADYDDVIELYSVRVRDQGFAPAPPVRLHPPFAPDSGANVLDFRISGDRVIFRADFEQDETSELYSVPISGGELVKLNGPLTGGGDVSPGYIISAGRVIYIADQDTNNTWELYSASIEGGDTIKISAPMMPESEVLDFSVDADRAVYRVRQGSDGPVDLYSASTQQDAPIKLNSDLNSGEIVFTDYRIFGDLALFRAGIESRPEAPSTAALYSNLLVGGELRQLNAGGTVLDYQIGNGRVAYRADQDTPGVWELYRARVVGGDMGKLSGPMTPGGGVRDYTISGDQLIYRADQDIDEVVMLYSVNIRDGGPVRLNPDLVPGADISAEYTVRGGRVVYLSDQDAPQDFSLYSVPLTGGAVIRLNAPLPASGDVLDFTFDAFLVIYLADQEANERAELYSIPLEGGPPRRLNSPLNNGTVIDFQAEDGLVSYLAEDGNGGTNLFGTTLDCSAPVAPDPEVKVFVPRLNITTTRNAATLTWNIDLRSSSRIPGYGVTLTTTLPTALPLGAVNASLGELRVDGQTVTVTVRQFNPGQRLDLSIATTPTRSGTIEVLACAGAIGLDASCATSGPVTLP